MMQYHFKRYYIVDIKCSTSDIIVLSQKAVFTVFEISEKLRVQKVQHVIYFACKCELNSFNPFVRNRTNSYDFYRYPFETSGYPW